mgnify:CR=1 FL=1
MRWVGQIILDLSSGLVHILLPIWLILHVSLLLGTGLLNRLSVLLWLKFALVVIICGLVVLQRLVFSFCNESLVHQGLKIWKVEHAESTPKVLV